MTDELVQTGFPLRLARRAATKVVRALAPVCTRLRVCGSVRREEDWVGDIDIVVTPHQAKGLFDTLTDAWADSFLNLVCRGGLSPGGTAPGGTGLRPVSADAPDKHNPDRSSPPPERLWKVEGACVPTSKRITLRSLKSEMKVELWPVLPESFGWMLLIRTGPRQVGTGLMRCAQARGFKPEVQRCLSGWAGTSGTGSSVIPMRTEHEACAALGVRWQPARTDARLELARDLHAIADAANVPTETSAAPGEEYAS